MLLENTRFQLAHILSEHDFICIHSYFYFLNKGYILTKLFTYTLKMKAACSEKTLVPTNQTHRITFTKF